LDVLAQRGRQLESVTRVVVVICQQSLDSLDPHIVQMVWNRRFDAVAQHKSLLADLALHRLDVVLSDQAMPASIGVRAFTHPLGESGISFFAARRRAGALSRGFPDSLDGAPVLLPSERSATRRALDDWFERNGLRPKIVAEVDDSALLKAFGQAGAGAFPAPTAIADEVERMYGARRIGEAEGVHETYLALSAERHLRHPALIRITEAARSRLARSAK
jgi:LysR family transcriptional activator of nhaA